MQALDPQNYKFTVWSIMVFCNAAILLLLGGFVYFKNKKAAQNVIFSLNTFFLGIIYLGMGFVLSTHDETLACFWDRIVYLASSSFFPVLYRFGLIFCHIKTNLQRKIQKANYYISAFFILLLLFKPELFMKGVYVYSWGVHSKAALFYHFFMLWAVIITSAFLVTAYIHYRKSDRPSEKQQIKNVFIAFLILGIGALSYLTAYGIGIVYPLVFFAGPIFFAIVGHTIIRYRLMEIDTVVHRTVLWIFTSVVIFVPISIVVYLLHPFLVASNWVQLALSVTTLVYAYLFFYPRIQPHIDHLFRRRKYDYQTILGRVAEKIAATINIEELARQFLTEVCDAMYLRNSVLYVLEEHEEKYLLIGARGYKKTEGIRQAAVEIYAKEDRNKLSDARAEIKCGNPVYIWLARGQNILEKEQVDIDPQYLPIKQEAMALFQEQELELIVPLIFENKVTAILGLGKKESLQAYTIKDLELLRKLGHEAGVTVYNALHHEDLLEKERMDEEMKMGRQIQMSLLPQEMPSVRNLSIQGLTLPAKEIGGDYYDFIFQPEEEKLAIIIGDVSGKGVGAGLLMSMVKATIQNLTEEGFSPKDILLRANKFLYRQIGGQKFMTLLYLSWQPNAKTLTYSSAGHEHILICRAGRQADLSGGRGTVEVVTSGGFMLGMIENIDNFLEERQIVLAPRDKILLYTDGVTEAEDGYGERFGLERLRESFHRHSYKSANELIQGIKEEVNLFVGTRPQYDDITLVVMEAA